MATTNIIPFADATSNLYSDVAYQAFAPTGQPLGYQPPSDLHNKVFLQSSIIVTALAEFIANYQANDVLDSDTPTNIASYLLVALKTALGLTAPQFDNSTALATTQFVQRALGNYQDFLTLFSDTILTPAEGGKFILCEIGTGPYTVTLPLSSTVIPGVTLTFAAYGDDTTFLTQGGDIINIGGVAVSAYPVRHGAFLTLIASSGGWVVGGGNTNINYQDGWRHSYIINSGYQVFPVQDLTTGYYYCHGWANGAVILPNPTTGYTIPVAFPITFQTVLDIGATPGGASGNLGSSGDTTCGVQYFDASLPTSGAMLRLLRLAGANNGTPYLFRVSIKGLVL